MQKKKTLKDPNNDYPLFGYRVMPAMKDSLTKLLEEVLDRYNSELAEDEKPFKKNEIFIKALKRGLVDMKKAKK